MKRVLLFSEPGRDGVFVFVRSLANFLHAHHPEIGVDLAYSSKRSVDALNDLVRSVEARGGRAIDLRIGNAPAPADAAATRKLLSLVRERCPDIVHAHSSKAGALARLCRMLPSFPPVLYTPHAYYGMPRLGGAKEHFYNLLEMLLGQAGITHNCSEDERDFARDVLRLDPQTLFVVHHGIDTKLYSPATPAEKARLREAIGIPVEGKLLVTIGRDAAQKNYAPLYSALREVLPGANWYFGHAGAGSVELRENLPSPARDRVFAFTHLEDTSTLLRAADGFILTSRYEGLSLSMLHALSCGLEMILTNVPGMQLLRPLGFSSVRWLSNRDSVPEITSTLQDWARGTFIGAPEQRALAIELFTENTQFEKLVTLYRQTVRLEAR
jgi:glycosyltransferase involved in cell wall biosynthesis